MSLFYRKGILSRGITLLTLIFFSFNMTVSAAMITTLQTVNPVKSANVSNTNGIQLINRAELTRELILLGVAPEHVKNRLASMTDVEITALTSEISELPAGGDALTIIAVVFLVLLFTDIAGYTDLFPFVKKNSSKTSSTKSNSEATDRREVTKGKQPIVIEN